jgi:DNA-binding IclR family transcriptional regulator
MKTIRTVERALQILNAFRKERKSLKLGELYKHTELPKPTLLRLLTTMQEEGFIIKNKNDNTYILSPVFIDLANVVLDNIDLRSVLRPAMERLKEISNETINIYVRNGINRICIDQLLTDRLLKKFSKIGDTFPLYCGASGKVLLAFSEKGLWEQVVQETGLKGLTDNTITDKQLLYKELEKIKNEGYAVSYGEREEDIISIAVPIFSRDGKVAVALAISGPYNRLIDKVDYYKTELLKEAKDVSYKYDL